MNGFSQFNVDQCEGLPVDAQAPPPGEIIPAADAVIAATGADNLSRRTTLRARALTHQ
jgi:antirestriction protein ArdC